MKTSRLFLFTLAALCLFTGLVFALLTTGGYLHARSVYDKARQTYAPMDPKQPKMEGAKEDGSGAADPTAQGLTQTDGALNYLRQIDLQKLSKEYADARAWLYVPKLDLSYPVLQGADNAFYLNHDLEGQTSYAGSIFMDASCAPDMKGLHSILYGHNMRDKTMFGALGQLKKDPDSYFYLLCPEEIRTYRIFRVCEVMAGSDNYRIQFQTGADYRSWQRRIGLEALAAQQEELWGQPVVTLSTCTRSADTRLIVQGILTRAASLDEI